MNHQRITRGAALLALTISTAACGDASSSGTTVTATTSTLAVVTKVAAADTTDVGTATTASTTSTASTSTAASPGETAPSAPRTPIDDTELTPGAYAVEQVAGSPATLHFAVGDEPLFAYHVQFAFTLSADVTGSQSVTTFFTLNSQSRWFTDPGADPAEITSRADIAAMTDPADDVFAQLAAVPGVTVTPLPAGQTIAGQPAEVVEYVAADELPHAGPCGPEPTDVCAMTLFVPGLVMAIPPGEHGRLAIIRTFGDPLLVQLVDHPLTETLEPTLELVPEPGGPPTT